MKKFLLLIVSFVYLLSVTGLSFDLHYCMGKLADVEWFGVKDDKCGRCGMQTSQKKKGCCHNEPQFVKVNDEHQFSDYFQVSIPDFNITQLPTFVLAGADEISVFYEINPSHAPPLQLPPIYLKNRVFRI